MKKLKYVANIGKICRRKMERIAELDLINNIFGILHICSVRDPLNTYLHKKWSKIAIFVNCPHTHLVIQNTLSISLDVTSLPQTNIRNTSL